ncbi:hypothetical protein RIF29_22199 [Crotalaria pallida]|uniref:Uncharacterized protein n=1 Tax=Crotalaria pallida TaxID=3830 RepID=A0AAN9F474_CROPI
MGGRKMLFKEDIGESNSNPMQIPKPNEVAVHATSADSVTGGGKDKGAQDNMGKGVLLSDIVASLDKCNLAHKDDAIDINDPTLTSGNQEVTSKIDEGAGKEKGLPKGTVGVDLVSENVETQPDEKVINDTVENTPLISHASTPSYTGVKGVAKDDTQNSNRRDGHRTRKRQARKQKDTNDSGVATETKRKMGDFMEMEVEGSEVKVMAKKQNIDLSAEVAGQLRREP